MDGEVFAVAAGMLRSMGCPDLAVDLATDFDSLKPFVVLDEKEKKNFMTRLTKTVNDGLASNKKDSLLGYLQVSARAREKFSQVTRVAVELSPPSKLKSMSQDFHAVWDSAGTLTVIVNQKSIVDCKTFEGFGPAIDAAMQLCALTDVYMDKAKLAIGQTVSAASQLCPPLQFEVDWSFIESPAYVKLAEDARSAAVATVATLAKTGLLEKKDGLASHLQRSARATASFAEHIQTVLLAVDPDSRCKVPFELTEAGAGVLRISVKLNGLDKSSAAWGPAVDERYALRVVDEEGARAVQNACEQHVQHLPAGTRLEVDWNFMNTDKWRKMKPEERVSALNAIAKKTLATGCADKRDGLAALFAKSARVRQIFTEKVGVVQLRVELSGVHKPLLLEGGVLSLPCVLASLDDVQPWSALTDTALALRVQDEVELRKYEAAIEKTGCAGLPVLVDWSSFLDDPAMLRQPKEKRMSVAATMLSVVQGGIGGRQGLGSHGAALAAEVDRVHVRASTTVKAKTGVELRYGEDRVVEVMVKTLTLTSGTADTSSWLPMFVAAKNDGATACPFAWPYPLLAEADGNTACSVESPPPVQNPLLAAAVAVEAVSPYHAAPVASVATTTTATAPPMTDMKAAAPKAASPAARVSPSPPPAARPSPSPPPGARVAASPPPTRASPPPAKAAATPSPAAARIVASPPPTKSVTAAAPPARVVAVAAAAPVPAPSSEGVPAEYACPALWKTACDSAGAVNRACGCAAVPVIDWSFVESAAFAAMPEATKKQAVSNLGVRVFQPLDKELAKLAKRHSLYAQSLALLTAIQVRYDYEERVMDTASGKAGKTHYSVAVLDGGAVLSVALNLSQHMAGIIPALEGKLLVAYGVQHVVALQEAEKMIALRGEKAKIECVLDSAYFAEHDAFLRQPITMDSIAWWAQVAKEADTALGKLIGSIELASKDAIFAAAFRARFASILVQPDPAASVRDVTPPPSWTMLENAELCQLVFRYNMNDGAQAGQAAAVKLASFVNVRLAQAAEAARKDANEQLIKFRPTVAGTELSMVDFFDQLSELRQDKAIEGCKAFKTWLAAMLRQLGLIVQRSPVVFKSKVRAIQFGLDPTNANRVATDCIVAFDSDSGVLSMVQNFDTAAKPDPTVSQRVDGLLDVTMYNLQAEVTVEMTQRSQSLSNALRSPGVVVNLDFSFERDPSFVNESPQVKAAKVKKLRNHVEATLEAIIKCGAEAAAGLVAVWVSCDCTNSVHDPVSGATDAEHYACLLDGDGLFRVITNLALCDRPLGRLHHKVEQQLALHRARLNTAYHWGPERFDWESLQGCSALLNDTILVHLEASLNVCREAVVTFAKAVEQSRSESPAGRDSIARMEHIVVRMDRTQVDAWAVLNPEPNTLVLSLSLAFVKEKQGPELLRWKEALEWTLKTTVEVEKHHGEKLVAAAKAALQKAFGSAIGVAIDWATYVDTAEFLDNGAEGCRNIIRRLSKKLLDRVVAGMVAIAGHPIGKKALGGKTKLLTVLYGPRVDVAQRLLQPCKVSVREGGELLVAFRNLDSSCEADYKSRIEFELGVVVDVAEYDATARHETVSAALGKLSLTYDLLGFQNTDEFRYGFPIASQPLLVDAVVAGVAEHVWGSKKDGLLSAWEHAKKVVKSACVEISVAGEYTCEHGRLELRGDALVLTLDLGGALQFKDSRNWRPRIASVCGFLDELSTTEAIAKLAQTEKELRLCPVAIDWAFLAAPQWQALPAADRYERAHSLGGELGREILLGYWGLAGMAAFPNVKSSFLGRIKNISLVVDAAQAKGTYRTEVAGTTLRIVLTLDELRQWPLNNSIGCRERVEKCMSLRKQVEQDAIAEQDEALAHVAAQLGGKAVTVAWDKLLASEDYLAERDYVAYIRHVGGFMGPLLLGYGELPKGIMWAVGRNAEAAEVWGVIDTIEVVVDGTCTERPPQDRYVNGNMSAMKKGSTLVVTVRRDWMEVDQESAGNDEVYTRQTHFGCGSVVQWTLAPGSCRADEQSRLETYKDELIGIEEARRRSAIEQWQYRCEREISDYNRDMQEYASAATRKCSSKQCAKHVVSFFLLCCFLQAAADTDIGALTETICAAAARARATARPA